MKKNMMRRNLRQSIVKSLGRYIAIMAIIALGAGIFVGLRMTKADMVATGQLYTDRQNMFDLRLINSYGWGIEQVESVAALEGVTEAEGIFYTDLVAHWEIENTDKVYRFYNIPQTINQLSLLRGRLPEAPDEILADGYFTDESVLGTKVVISRQNEEESLEACVYDTYTVVGCVSTPLYMDMNRGTTSVGSGTITNYFFVPMEGLDVDYVTEIHVTMPGNWSIYTEEYDNAMEALAEKLEPQLEPLAWDRLRKVKQQAQEDWDEGYAEYQDGVQELKDAEAEAEAEIRKAYRDLLDGEQELIDAREQLIDGEQQIEDGWEQLEAGKVQLENSRAALENGRKAAEEKMAKANKELLENHTTVTGNLQQVVSGLAQLNAGLAELNSGISQLEAGLAQMDSGIAAIDLMISLIDASILSTQQSLEMAVNSPFQNEYIISQLNAQLVQLQASREDYVSQKQELLDQRAPYDAQLKELYVTRSGLLAQKQELENNKAMLEDALAAIEAGFLELQSGQMEAQKQFAAAEAQISAGAANLRNAEKELKANEEEIAKGWEELEAGEQELKDGWEEYYSGVQELRRELKDAKAELLDARLKLDDGRKTIEEMTEISIHVLDRNTNVGYVSLESGSDIVQAISRVLPVFFLLVASLVCITTMTRMVEDERTQIGTLKALGYSNAAIIGKYLGYAGSGALLGCGLGVLIGSVVFPSLLWEAYKILLFVQPNVVLTVNAGLCLAVVGAYTAVILTVTWYCCRKALQEVPAELIRPKSPDPGKKLIFEKWKLWNRVSFLNKVMIRNIFRYKQRLAMMLVGIGGCTALLLTGFGLRDSIVKIVDFQYGEVTHYDLEVNFDGGLTEYQMEDFRREAKSCAEDLMFYYQTSMEVEFDDRIREIYMMSAGEEIQHFIDFHNDDGAVPMPGVGEVVLSVGSAEALGIRPGDRIILRNSDMRELSLTVSGLYHNYVYNYCLVLPESIEAQWGSLPEQHMAMVKLKDGYNLHGSAAALMALDDVVNVSLTADMAELVGSMMSALDMVVVMVVFCAAMLAAIVLYNLTNINITERIREIATIKVLGFRAGETAAYVFKENLTLSAMGTVLGLAMGKLLLEFVIMQVKIDMVWLDTRIQPMSYVLSVVLTMLTACIVDWIFYYRLEKINMAEALKSVE